MPPFEPALERFCLFVRAPELHKVKTRLARQIGPRAALAAYLRLVAHSIAGLQHLDAAVMREIWFAGAADHPQLHAWSARLRAVLRAQPQGDLGQRMFAATVAGTPARAQSVVIVGADCPTVDAALVTHAFRVLRAEADVVIAPAEDGGYGLIGMRRDGAESGYHASPFSEIDWGTERVAEQTARRCRSLGLHLLAIEDIWDVDELVDWTRFLERYGN